MGEEDYLFPGERISLLSMLLLGAYLPSLQSYTCLTGHIHSLRAQLVPGRFSRVKPTKAE